MIKILIACLLFLLSIVLIGQNLNKPFWGEHDWNGVRYGNIARNYLKYGYFEYKLAQIENSGPVEGQKLEAFTHYPPLLPIVISLSYKIFGVSEWSTRLIPLFATAGSIVLIYLIGDFIWNRSIGMLASLISLATPMVLYFGKNASHEPLVLFFILFAFYGYQRLLKSKKMGKIIFITGLILAEMTTWTGYFLIPAITLVLLLKRDFKSLKGILPFWILSILVFLTHLAFVYFSTGAISGGNLFEAALQRSGLLQGVQPHDFNLLNYILKIRLWFSTLFTSVLITFVVIWLISKRFIRFSESDWQLIILGLVGLIYAAVFSNALFIHNYLAFYFLPFFAISSALGIYALKNIKVIKLFFWVFAVLAVFLVGVERRNFIEALNKSNADQLAVKVGQAIKQNTRYEDIVLVSPVKFSQSADKFLHFYSDRQLTYEKEDKHTVEVLVDTYSQKFEIIDVK